VLSDLPPERADSAWYALRGWIERGFKHAKSGGWNWQDTRMTDPARAGRQWLAMAVASVLLMREGTVPELQTGPAKASPTQPQDRTSAPTSTPPAPAARPPRRILSVFRKGLSIVQSLLLADVPPPAGRFVPEPWPQPMSAVTNTTPPAHPP
jgi:hypothetical protein